MNFVGLHFAFVGLHFRIVRVHFAIVRVHFTIVRLHLQILSLHFRGVILRTCCVTSKLAVVTLFFAFFCFVGHNFAAFAKTLS